MTVLIDFFHDFETRSRVDLKVVGPINYATHPSTEATLLTWCFGRTGEIKAWRYGQPFPEELKDVALHPEKYNIVAHNIQFDFLIWTIPFRRAFPFIVKPDIKNLSDNMALTQHYRVGASLESAAQMMELPYSKDKEGRRLMLKQCKPNSKGEWYELTADEWVKFEHYGKIDTRLLRDIYYMLPALPPEERWAWEWTLRRNLRGIKIDVPLVNVLNHIVDTAMPKLTDEFFRLTSGQATVNSPTKTVQFFKQYYPWIENMQADTVRDMLNDKRDIPPFVRRALEIKDLAGSTSISKLKTANNIIYSSRVYNVLAYHQAQTKRWAGRDIQIQNFPRPDGNRPDKIDFDLNVHNLADEVAKRSFTLKDPIGFCKNLLRRVWLPDEGMVFYCGDWSKIEPTVLFWLVGLGAIPPKWYEDMAATIYNKQLSEISKDSDERQVGKTANLSCGYGSGPSSFVTKLYKDTGISMSLEMGTKVVRSYRAKYMPVVRLWSDLESAFKAAVLYKQSTTICNGKIHIFPLMNSYTKGVAIRLPSGGHLFYPHARLGSEGLEYLSDFGKGKVLFKKIYGGLITENVVSAISREIILPAIYRLEQKGFDVLNLIHDEMWSQAEAGRDKEYVELMCVRPSWCQDMEIGAECKNGVRYLK